MGEVNGVIEPVYFGRLGEIVLPKIRATHRLDRDAMKMRALREKFPFSEYRNSHMAILDPSAAEAPELKVRELARIIEGTYIGDMIHPSHFYLQIHDHAWADTSWIEDIAHDYIEEWHVRLES